MRSSRLRTVAISIGVSAALVMGSVLLVKLSRPVSLDAANRVIDDISRIQHLDLDLQRQVLAARHGALEQYDPVVQSAKEMKEAFARTTIDLQTVFASESVAFANLQSALKSLECAIDEHQALLESFKPRNAIAKNSLRYLPLAWRQYALAPPKEDALDALENAERMVHDVIDTHVTQTDSLAESAKASLDQFQPTESSGKMLKRHAERVFEMGSTLAPLVDALLDQRVHVAATGLRADLDRELNTAAKRARIWEFVLFGWGAVLIVLVVGVVGKLRHLYATLERQVTDRTAALSARNHDMRLIFDHLDQGFMKVDHDGSVAMEHSEVLHTWFGPIGAEKIWDVFKRIDHDMGTWFELAWEEAFHGFLPPAIGIEQLPATLCGADGRQWHVEATPTFDASGEVGDLVFVVNETTESLAHARAEAQQREVIAIFNHILIDRDFFLGAFAECTKRVAAVIAATDNAVRNREIHTLKGNAASIGLTSVSEWCHATEDHILVDCEPFTDVHRVALRGIWDRLQGILAPLVSEDHPDCAQVPRSTLIELHHALAAGADRGEVAEAVLRLALDPIQRRFDHLEVEIGELAERLGKGPLQVKTIANGLYLPHDALQPFWASLGHVIRNAVDHGIETAEDRLRAGKPAAPTITLEASQSRERFILVVRDDGRGINWDAVRAKAAGLGVSTSTDAELKHALFIDEMSTRDSATNTSGRGIGLSAVLAATESLHGTIEISSTEGEGTAFAFSFPSPSIPQA